VDSENAWACLHDHLVVWPTEAVHRLAGHHTRPHRNETLHVDEAHALAKLPQPLNCWVVCHRTHLHLERKARLHHREVPEGNLPPQLSNEF